MRILLRTLIVAIIAFFIPYIFVGAMHIMGSLNYWVVVSSAPFIEVVVLTTIFAVIMYIIKELN
jgi:hypothetical protein